MKKNLTIFTFLLFSVIYSPAQTYTISGTLTYTKSSASVLNSVMLYLFNNGLQIDSAMTDYSGYYQFHPHPNGTYTVNSSINNIYWQGVTPMDAYRILDHFTERFFYFPTSNFSSSIQLHSGDVDMSGFLNVTDAVKILRMLMCHNPHLNRNDWIIEKPSGGDTINVSPNLNDTVFINNSNVIQNFYAECVGDPDCSDSLNGGGGTGCRPPSSGTYSTSSFTSGITSIGTITSCPGTIVTVPVNYSGRPSIFSGFSFEIDYDPAVLSAIQTGSSPSFITNINSPIKFPLYAWYYAQTDESPGIKKIRVACVCSFGNQLDTNLLGVAHLFDIQFRYFGGFTSLTFNNSSFSGQCCEFVDSAGDAIPDNPTIVHYQNGSVSQGFLTGNITGSQTPCHGSNVYSIVNSPGATYTWSNTGGYSGTSASNSITYNFSGTSIPGVISVMATNACGNGPVISFAITGIADSSIVPVSLSASSNPVCSSVSDTLQVNGGHLGYSANWNWYIYSCGGMHISTGSSLIVNPVTQTTWYVRAEGTCNTTSCASIVVTIKLFPSVLSPIAGPIHPIQGAIIQYYVINDTNTTTYIWTAPSGWSGNSTGCSITFIAGSSQGLIKVTPFNSCGQGIADSLDVGAGYSISGHVNYPDTISLTLDSVWVSLYLNGLLIDSTQTDINGFYKFDSLNPGSYNIKERTYKPWGGVNSTDAVKIKRHFAGSELFKSSLKLHAADVNLSFSINTTDAVKLTRRFVGADTSFARGDWVFEKPFGGDTINVSIYINDSIIINSSNVVQNIKGLCVGDVNGSNIPPSGAKSRSKVSLNSGGTSEIYTNEEHDLPVIISNDVNVTALSLIMNYPGRLTKIIGIRPSHIFDENNFYYKIFDNEIRIGWFESNGAIYLNKGDTLFSLKLKNNGDNNPGEIITFTIKNDPICEFADENAEPIQDVALITNKVKYISPTNKIYSDPDYDFTIYPNPSNGMFIIHFNFIPGNSSVNIYNTLGELVQKRNIDPSSLKDGKYLEIEILDEGIYFVKFLDGYRTLIKKVVIKK